MTAADRALRMFHLSVPLGIALAGGFLAHAAGTPLPWMLGALVTTAALAMTLPLGSRFAPPLPAGLRAFCVGVIGVMVGGSFTPDLVASVGHWWKTMIAMVIVTIIMQIAGFLWLRRLLKLDNATAWFAAAPGGLIESVSLGEAAGGDLRIISVLQFLRIVFVVLTLPLAFTLWQGGPVGSAAGLTIGAPVPLTLFDGVLLAACVIVGGPLGQRLRLPAGFLLVPMLLSGAAHATGLVHGQVPPMVVAAAQWIMGASLGLRFAGLPRGHLIRAIGAAISALALSLVIVAAMTLAIMPFADVPPEVLILAFTPGGVVEMGLIALSIGANPVFVTAHHVCRIVIAVAVLPQIFQRRLAGPVQERD